VGFEVPVLPPIGEGANRSARGARAPQEGITMLKVCAVARSLATRKRPAARSPLSLRDRRPINRKDYCGFQTALRYRNDTG
jgi:hypothetical protein